MKRTYNKPALRITFVDAENLLAASGDNDPNKVTGGGSGVNTGGYSQEGGGSDTDGDGTVDDMAKKNAWSDWD